MNADNKFQIRMPPVKMAVIFDQILSVGGGFQQSLNMLELFKSLNKEYCEPIFFTTHHENLELLSSFGIDAIYLKTSRVSRLLLMMRGGISSTHFVKLIQKIFGFNSFESQLIKFNIDLVYFISPSSWSNYLERLNYVITIWDLCHRDYPEFPEVRIDRTFESRENSFKKNLIKSTAVIVDSNLGKSNIIKRYGLDEKRVYVLPFSESLSVNKKINLSTHNLVDIKKKYSINTDYLFYPAQFWPHKNHVYILQGLYILKNKFGMKISAFFAGGDGGNLEYIKSVVKNLDLSDQIVFGGFVDDEDLPSLYKSSIALVMPSYFGPTNIPPIEAFALGVPVLYSNLPGLNDQVEGAALLLDLNNPESMADNIISLLNDQNLRDKLIEAGFKKFQKSNEYSRADIINLICKDFQIKRYCWK